MVRSARLLALAPLIVAVACSSTSAHTSAPASRPAGTGGPAGTLDTAARTMVKAASYRFVAAIDAAGRTTRVTGEFQAPDRLHEIITSGASPAVETVFAGGRVFVRDARSGQWSQPTTAAGTPAAPDPRLAFAWLEQADHVSQTGSVFRFSLPSSVARQLVQTQTSTAAVTGEGTATAAAEGISHLEFDLRGASGGVRIVLDYTAIGRGPSVTQPI